MPFACENPRATSLALYRSTFPFASYLTLNSHLQLMVLRSRGRSVIVHVLFFISDSYSLCAAFSHSLAFSLRIASLNVCGSLTAMCALLASIPNFLVCFVSRVERLGQVLSVVFRGSFA